MSNIKVSIITPCYNSESTLRETLDSVVNQTFDFEYEHILVDDGSSDNTKAMIKEYSGKYSFMSHIFHDMNKGGGASRNTGIHAAQGELIYIIDSDDVLPVGILNSMVKYLDDEKLDGVAFAESRIFFNNNFSKTAPLFYDSQKVISMESLFNGMKVPVLANFLYSKKSYIDCGGYTEEHGFDTQSFGFKYITYGFKVGICPGSYYWHRQFQTNKKSYYEREFENGKGNINNYYICEEFLHLLSAQTIEFILDLDFRNDNILNELKKLYQNKPTGFFNESVDSLLCVDGNKQYIEKNMNSTNLNIRFVVSICHIKNEEYDKAIKVLSLLINEIPNDLFVFNYLRASLSSINFDSSKILSTLQDIVKVKNRNSIRSSFAKKIIGKLKKVLK